MLTEVKNMIEEVKQNLMEFATPSMKNYLEKLVPNCLQILGVSIPNLKKIAKKICKLDYKRFIAEYDASSLELQMLVGIVIATADFTKEDRFFYINWYVSTIQDWAVCDCFVSSLKWSKNHLQEMLDFMQKYKESHKEFEVRFFVVMLLTYYLRDEYFEQAFEIVCNLHIDFYYSKMAVAWFLATLMIDHPLLVMGYLKDCSHDDFIILKTIRKIQESYRISPEAKIQILKYRK